MQNMYVADVGDYGKYGLLRAVLPAEFRLGVIWYLVEDEVHLNDGRHTDYLNSLKFIECDRELFCSMRAIISSGRRNVGEIERAGVLGGQTVFYSERISCDGIKANTPAGRAARLLKRAGWLANARRAVRGCDAVFLDPDNGLETPSVPKHSGRAPKYVYYDEVAGFLSEVDTVIVYHHLSRAGDHLSQIRQRGKVLQGVAGEGYKVVSLRFRPYSPRAYFIITKAAHLINHVKRFVESNWSQCFELVAD